MDSNKIFNDDSIRVGDAIQVGLSNLEPRHTGVTVMKNSGLHPNVFLRTLEMPFTFDIWAKNAPITIKS